MPHLMLVSHNYAPEPTGIPYYNTAMAEWFVCRGWRVTVLTGIPHYPWWQVPEEYAQRDYSNGRGDEVINGVRVMRVRHFVPRPPVSGKDRMALDASYVWNWLLRAGTLSRRPEDRPDAIIGVAPPFLIGALLIHLRHLFRAPVVYHVQDLQVDAALDLNMLPSWLRQPLRACETWQLERVDLVTACGRGMLPRLTAKGQLRMRARHWPNWADIDLMRPWRGPNPERAALHGTGGACRVLYSGNLGRKQGLDVLLKAARLLAKATRGSPEIALTIAGAGAERQALAHAAYDLPLVAIQDLRPTEHLRPFLAAADIHVIPMRRESADLVLPSKLLNILAVGRPVVVTADSGTELAEMVRDSGGGLVVPPEDPVALATALQFLAANPLLCQHMGESGRKWIVENLGIDAVLKRVERDLLGLVRAKGLQKRIQPTPSRFRGITGRFTKRRSATDHATTGGTKDPGTGLYPKPTTGLYPKPTTGLHPTPAAGAQQQPAGGAQEAASGVHQQPVTTTHYKPTAAPVEQSAYHPPATGVYRKPPSST